MQPCCVMATQTRAFCQPLVALRSVEWPQGLRPSIHGKSLVSTHDHIANKEYPMGQSAAMNARAPSVGDDSARIVSIGKQQEPLGATLGVKNGKIAISRVLHCGAAQKSGLHPGDIIHEINGKSILGSTVDAVTDLIAELRGTVEFKITPATSDQRPRRQSQPEKYMRALFSYDPQQDRHAPCPEAGLKFKQGDILQVVNEDDPNWWQAVHYGEESMQAGIIPSKSLKEKYMLECLEEVTEHQTTKKRRKAKKTLHSSVESKEFGQQVITYEQVAKIDPQVDRPRPIMIVAPRGGPFNLEDLSARLVDGDPERYGTPIPHTSRPPQPGEAEKQIYHFVSKKRMEKDIRNNQFVEHGVNHDHYYGTSINSIRSVIDSKKTCILVLIPQAIKLVRTAELKPFMVYCRAPNINYMKKHWVPKGQIKESQTPDIFRQAGFLERTYSHYFDHTVLFTDLDTAVLEVNKIADRLTKEPQWVPSSWVYPALNP